MPATTIPPYSAIAYVTETSGGLRYRGSGVLITPDELLTAAHLVYSSDYGPSTGITVAPGYDNGVAPFGTARGLYAHYNPIATPGGLLTTTTIQSDFAVIHLDRSFNIAPMGLLSNFAGGAVHRGGYPSTTGTAQSDIIETVTKEPGLAVLDGAPAAGGGSGGPLWIADALNRPQIVGLVSGASLLTGYNVQITDADIAQILSWVQMDDATEPGVNSTFYRAAYADVAAAPMSAAYHYHTSGWHEGRNPNQVFSTNAYLATYTDVAAANIDPLQHYDESGWREGRDPSATFDTTLYLLHNPDVARLGLDPLAHYVSNGAAEGRATYAAIGTDIRAGFDAEYYRLANPDVARSGIDPLQHFLAVGWREGRNPDAVFDIKGYLNAYADVRAAGLNPLVHYMAVGWREGRDPSAAFDTRAYLRGSPDVAAAGLNPLQHYLTSGAYEFRTPVNDGTFNRPG